MVSGWLLSKNARTQDSILSYFLAQNQLTYAFAVPGSAVGPPESVGECDVQPDAHPRPGKGGGGGGLEAAARVEKGPQDRPVLGHLRTLLKFPN